MDVLAFEQEKICHPSHIGLFRLVGALLRRNILSARGLLSAFGCRHEIDPSTAHGFAAAIRGR